MSHSIGVVGLGVMGRNLALNLSGKAKGQGRFLLI